MQRKRKKSGIKKEIRENIHNKAQINYIVQKRVEVVPPTLIITMFHPISLNWMTCLLRPHYDRLLFPYLHHPILYY